MIAGTIRAGQQQIFGFNRFEISGRFDREGRFDPAGSNLRLGVSFPIPNGMVPGVPATVTWPVGVVDESGRRVPCGRVVISSDDVPLVRPEWWGARAWDVSEIQAATTPPAGHDSWDAFQGAIDAACIGRAVRGRPPIPIALTGLYQIVRALEIRPPTGPSGALIPTCLVWRGTAGLRSRLATVARNPLAARTKRGQPAEVLLRLHPGVDFDLRDVSLSTDLNIDGVIEVVCDDSEASGRRGLLKRVTLTGTAAQFLLRIVETGNSTARRQFVVDSCALVQIPNLPCRHDVQLDTGPGVMLRVSNTLMGPPTQPNEVLQLTPEAIGHATCHLTGGAALLDSLLFHQALGPRPSRDPPLLDEPDGQDIFLGAPSKGSGRPATQLTVMMCESQGFWLLGRDSNVTRAHQAVLLGVAHYLSVDARNDLRWTEWTRQPPPTEAQASSRMVPSVVWRGAVGQCVMIGCRLGMSMVLSEADTIVNVATTFNNLDVGDSRKLYLREEHMVRRGTGYTHPDLAMASNTFDGAVRHLVPILEDGRMVR